MEATLEGPDSASGGRATTQRKDPHPPPTPSWPCQTPRKGHVQSYRERQVPGRPVKMHQNRIFLLLFQHLHQHVSSLPPQQSLETLQDLEMPIPLPGSGTQAHPAGMGQPASGGGRSSLRTGRSSAELCGPCTTVRMHLHWQCCRRAVRLPGHPSPHLMPRTGLTWFPLAASTGVTF